MRNLISIDLTRTNSSLTEVWEALGSSECFGNPWKLTNFRKFIVQVAVIRLTAKVWLTVLTRTPWILQFCGASTSPIMMITLKLMTWRGALSLPLPSCCYDSHRPLISDDRSTNQKGASISFMNQQSKHSRTSRISWPSENVPLSPVRRKTPLLSYPHDCLQQYHLYLSLRPPETIGMFWTLSSCYNGVLTRRYLNSLPHSSVKLKSSESEG